MNTVKFMFLITLLPCLLAESCPGCPTDSEVNKEIVESVMTELSYGDCQRSNVKVENFKSQVYLHFINVPIFLLCLIEVVSGIKYMFELVQSAGQCGNSDVEEKRCHVEVWSQPWLSRTEILWDQTTCVRE